MSLAGLGLQGITVSPRFIFGVNGELRNNLHLIDEHKILYTAGHNIVVYSTDEKNQYMLQGQEGTEKITTIAVSKSKRFLAVCERANRAMCTIYDIHSQKKKKTLPDQDVDCDDYQSKEFLSACFSPKNENQIIITLTGEPDWMLLFWDWDKLKIQAKINIGITGIPASMNQKNDDTDLVFNFQISFNPFEKDHIVVTGVDTFKYYKLENDQFAADHTQINNKTREITTKYTCHTWMADGKLVVCTEAGEIILCETDGSFLAFIEDSPVNENFMIESIVTFSRGFIVAGDSQIFAFEKCEDQRSPYRLIIEPIQVSIESKDHPLGSNMNYQITSMTMSHSEDYIYFITRSNQLLKVDIPLYDGADTKPKFDFVHCCYHTQEITGLDVCIRKQLIVTCSRDKTIKIWNYVTKTLEISHLLPEDALAVAFHPSGFHVVVSTQDKILLMNVLSKSLHQFKNIQQKNCHEIQFCHGGHLFATAYQNNAVYVYNFYTGENPSNYQCKGHIQRVKSIDWFEDDMGFVSAGMGGDVFFWDLINARDGSNRLMEKDFTQKSVQMSSVVNIPGRQHEVYCVGSDKRIWNNHQARDPYEANSVLSQVCMTHNGKALFAGVGETNKPGAIEIYKVAEDPGKNQLKMDLMNQVQAHSKPIYRMRLSFDNNQLFTVGKDGCLIIHDVKDRDPKGKARERDGLQFSDEILTEKQEIEQYIQEKETLENDLQGQGQESFDKVMKLKKLDDKINKLQEDLSSSQLQHRNRYDSLNENKRDMEAAFEERIRNLSETHQVELEENRNSYSQKMLEDAAKFQELQAKKEEEARNFEENIADVVETHNLNVNQIMDKHRSMMEGQIAQTEQLKKEIERQEQDNAEILSQIMQDALDEQKDIESKNSQNVKQVEEMSLKSKAELQLTNNKLVDLGTEIDQLKRQMSDKEKQLDLQKQEERDLHEQMHKKGTEILERDTMIGDKEKKIYSLKKKTQELEKFKFVLDYKIKELKRDIHPRGMEITRLKKETNEMDKRLRHYNKINANLGYIVDDLRTRQEHMQDLIKKNRTRIRTNDQFIKSFKNAVYWVVQYIDDFDQLKRVVNENLYQYVKEQEMKNVDIDADIKKEYENQRRYLENSKNSLKKRVEKEAQIHKEDNMNIMRDNIKLIKMISELRSKVKELKVHEKNTRTEARMRANQSQMMQDSNEKSGDQDMASQQVPTQEQEMKQKELEIKRQYIEDLRQRLAQAQQENSFLQQDFNQGMQQQMIDQQ